MTERLGSGDRQRGVARVVLGVLFLGFGILTVSGGITPILEAVAQQASPSPTGTRTEQPGGETSPSPAASPTGTQIQFLNPSKYSEPEIVSIKPDANDTYHLVAWVSQAPADAVVEFQLAGDGENFRHIGTATRVGADTFELQWDLAYHDAQQGGVEDGPYTLRARLYSQSGASPSASPSGSPSGSPSPSPSGPETIAFDDEQIVVEREAETVEITNPVNGGQLGHYDPDGPGPRRPGFTMRVVTSEGAERVRAFYSTARPGAEPHWTTCEEQVTIAFDDRSRTIGCTVERNDDGSNPLADVTAVAAVARDETFTTPDPCLPPVACTPTSSFRNESGDAHRVFAYESDPSTLSLTDAPPSSPRGSCQELTATVLDQLNRPVWRANVDVHATGPDDNLQFAVTQRTSPFRAPDQGSHETEFAWNCQNGENTSNRDQGVHPRAQPEADVHHIESRVGTAAAEPSTQSGTDLEGRFVFALRSSTLGTTQVIAWADEDDDDLRDNPSTGTNPQAVDPEDSTTINWTQPSPSPSSASPSPSASGTSPSPSPSDSSPTPTSPSPSGTSPSPAPREATLNCEPETDTNPVRSSHSIVCRVDQPGGSASPSPASTSGVRIHAEATGANDPDGTNSPATPDFTCVTGDDGSCVFTHGPGGTGSTGDVGATVYRAWIDSSNDAQVEADMTEGRDEFQQPGQKRETDDTDVVEKTWQRAPLDCDPEQDGNPTGTSHTITCRAATGAGDAPAGTNVDVEATGANDPDSSDTPESPDFTCTTGANASCTFTHGPGGTGTTNSEGVTRYRAWIDADGTNGTVEADRTEGRNESNEPGAVPESDETDVVDKTWTRTPTGLTMAPENDSASVGACNAFTITVTGDNDQPVSGVLVDVEQRHERAGNQTNGDEPRVAFCTPRSDDGPNPSAVDQTQGDLDPPDENPDNPGTLGGETLTATDAQGRVTIGIAVEPANGSDGSGDVAVTAFFETDDDDDPEAGEPQDTSTKTWIAAEGRTIVCEPENATNPVGSQHRVTCTVRDRFGAPVEGEGVTFTEDGAGEFASRGTRSNANGQVVAVTTSSQPGTQSITATLDDDLQGAEPGEVDECDRPAGTPANAPAGACSDTVSKTWTATATTTTSEPAAFGRTVALEAQKPRIAYNANVTLGGTVESDAAAPVACTDFVEVNILRDVLGGTSEFEVFATVQTDENGAFTHNFKADKSATYVAEVEELAGCDAATSSPEPVLVKVKVALKLSKTKIRKGGRVRFVIRTAPCPTTAGDKVLLFRAIDGKFGKTGKRRTDDDCRAKLRRRLRQNAVFQARWPKQSQEFISGKSRPKIVRVRPRR